MRQRIVLQSVSEARMEDSSRGIAYIKLEQFTESTINEIDSALMNLHQQGMQSLILDLRGNPGGLLTTAISLSDRFLPGGTIVSTRGRTAEDNTVELAHYPNTWKVPLIVLIDHNSASASEIFAAAIQENQRGLIIGEKSYGKGTVQTLFPLQTVSAALRLTTARFYSPDGREMAGEGVTPDIKVATDGETSGKKDPVLKEAMRKANEARVKEMARNPRRIGEATDEPKVAA
jgi:carboxyl-terminal processing protease